MAKKQDKFERKVILFSCGLIPVCDAFLQWRKKKPNSSTDQAKLEELKRRVLTSLSSTEKRMQAFVIAFPSWEKERLACIEEIKKIANNIDRHHRNINIAQLPTTVVGVTAGILTITGLALIPVTFGASLGLTITGAIIGTGATVTGVTTAVTDIGIRIDRLKKAKKCAEEHKKSTDNILKLAEELANNEVEAMAALQDCAIQCGGEVVKISTMSLINAGIIGKVLADTIPKASKSLHLLRRGFGLSAAASASSLRTVDVAGDVAGGATRVVATTTGRVFIGLGFAFSAIGIVVDLISAGAAIYDLAKGSKTSAANQLREQVENMEKEMNFLKDVYAELCTQAI